MGSAQPPSCPCNGQVKVKDNICKMSLLMKLSHQSAPVPHGPQGLCWGLSSRLQGGHRLDTCPTSLVCQFHSAHAYLNVSLNVQQAGVDLQVPQQGLSYRPHAYMKTLYFSLQYLKYCHSAGVYKKSRSPRLASFLLSPHDLCM